MVLALPGNNLLILLQSYPLQSPTVGIVKPVPVHVLLVEDPAWYRVSVHSYFKQQVWKPYTAEYNIIESGLVLFSPFFIGGEEY